MGTAWKGRRTTTRSFIGTDRQSDEQKVDRDPGRPGVRLQLAQLRAVSEVYAADDAKEKFVRDFVAPGPR
jgi:catalase-peroxidase